MSFIFESETNLKPSYTELYKHNINDCGANCYDKCQNVDFNKPWMKKGVCADDKHANKVSNSGYKGQYSTLEFSKYTPYTYDPQWEETHYNYPCQGPARVNGLWFQHTVKPFKQPLDKCNKCFFKRKYV